MTVKPKSSGKPSDSIWSQPAPGQRKPRHSREQIAAAALAIADREGFAAVSMRRVAEELGAATMTLYYYIRTKEDLVTLMDDTLMAEVLLSEETLQLGWRDALRALAYASRAAFLRHPWALYELHSARQGPNTMRHVEQSLEAVADAPLDDLGKLELLGIVDDFVFGHALRAQSSWKRPDPNDPEEQRLHAFLADQVRSGQYPRFAAMIGPLDNLDHDNHPWARLDADRAFERGLNAIFDAVPGWSAPAPAKKKRRSG